MSIAFNALILSSVLSKLLFRLEVTLVFQQGIRKSESVLVLLFSFEDSLVCELQLASELSDVGKFMTEFLPQVSVGSWAGGEGVLDSL